MPAPPRRSQVGGPPPDWKRWAPLLDGVPVGHCTAFDADEGWVQVMVVDDPALERPIRVAHAPQRRLFGRVEALPLCEWKERVGTMGRLSIGMDDDAGEPVPGTQFERAVRSP